jgi:heptaprenyl diphosphate synthase
MVAMTSNIDTSSLAQTLHLQELQAFVERVMSQQILRDEYILPPLSILQLTLSAIVVSSSELSSTARKHIVGAIMLMYHGLSLHDRIEEDGSAHERSGQLTILGGDYLSSLFYKLLADSGYIHLIGALSEAVAKINVAKASMQRCLEDPDYDEVAYYRDAMTIEGELVRTLSAELFVDAPVRQFIEAAISARVYGNEIRKGSVPTGLAMVNVMLAHLLGPEERRQCLTFSGTVLESKRVTLHAKYATQKWLTQVFLDAIQRLSVVGAEILGADRWIHAERLFDDYDLREGVTVVEGR